MTKRPPKPKARFAYAVADRTGWIPTWNIGETRRKAWIYAAWPDDKKDDLRKKGWRCIRVKISPAPIVRKRKVKK